MNFKALSPSQRLSIIKNQIHVLEEKIEDSAIDENVRHVFLDESLKSLHNVTLGNSTHKDLAFSKEVTIPLMHRMSLVRVQRALEEYLSAEYVSPLNWIEELSNDAILLDIGANLGIYSAFAHAWGYEYTLAVEPLDKNYAELLNMISLNRVSNLSAVMGACAPVGLLSQKRFTKLAQTTGNFAGAAHNRINEIDLSKISDYHCSYCPIYSIQDLIKEAISRATSQANCSAKIGKIVIKIDIDGGDVQLLQDLIDSGIASRLKAIIIEDESKDMETILEGRVLERNGLFVGAKSGLDYLILPQAI